MRLLVTGHCGFIGQNFVRMYHKQHQIVGIDKMGYASDKEAANFCTKHLELDIARSGFEAIFDGHFEIDEDDVVCTFFIGLFIISDVFKRLLAIGGLINSTNIIEELNHA